MENVTASSSSKPVAKFTVYQNPAFSAALTSIFVILTLLFVSAVSLISFILWENDIGDSSKLRYVPAYYFLKVKVLQAFMALVFIGSLVALLKALSLLASNNSPFYDQLTNNRQVGLLGLKPKLEPVEVKDNPRVPLHPPFTGWGHRSHHLNREKLFTSFGTAYKPLVSSSVPSQSQSQQNMKTPTEYVSSPWRGGSSSREISTFGKKPLISSQAAGSGGRMRKTLPPPKPSVVLSQSARARELEASNGIKMVAGKHRSCEEFGALMRRIRQKANLPPRPSVSRELEGSNGTKMAGKHRSSVLEDDIGSGSGGPTWQKANLSPLISSPELEGSNGSSKMAGKHRNLGSGGGQMAIVENGKTNAFVVPTESTQMATKILLEEEDIEKTSLKEKPSSSSSRRLAEKSFKSLDKVVDDSSSKNLLSSQDSQKSEGIEENPLNNVLNSMNPRNAPTTNSASTLALPVEPAFRMSVPEEEEDSQVLDDDDNHSSASAPPVPTKNSASSTLALPKKPAFRMSVPEYSEVLDDDDDNAPPVQGNPAPTSLLPAKPPQKKPAFQMSAPDVFDDDNHLHFPKGSTSLLTGHLEELMTQLMSQLHF